MNDIIATITEKRAMMLVKYKHYEGKPDGDYYLGWVESLEWVLSHMPPPDSKEGR